MTLWFNHFALTILLRCRVKREFGALKLQLQASLCCLQNKWRIGTFDQRFESKNLRTRVRHAWSQQW